MNPSPAPPSPEPSRVRVPSPQKTLRRLFLTLFLRGRSARGLDKQKTPRSIAQKLAFTVGLYALFGMMSLTLIRMPVFALSVYLHALTFAFLGMFVASSTGEVLFNKDESDILLHRPISPRTLLWAKIRVLLEASFWIAGGFNLVGFFVGYYAADGGWQFPMAHAISVGMEAMFCTGCVVMVYQLCLRSFGRERLEGLITTAQVILSVGAVVSAQVLPQLVFRTEKIVTFGGHTWWMALLPPAWFAGFDDAISGSMEPSSWLLAAFAAVGTVFVLWMAFDKLARDYETGLQRLSETVSTRVGKRASRRWIDMLIDLPPLRWWLRDPVERASFLLTAAYLVRDRDVKLRVYPGIAPMMVLPIIFLIQEYGREGRGMGGFGIAFASSYLGMIPMMGLSMLQYSQQWQASDIFRSAPLAGPAALCHGARRAVLCLLALPTLLVFAACAWFSQRDVSQVLLLLPGMIALPVYALIPNLGGGGVPLSQPTEEAKGAGRGLIMFASSIFSLVLSGISVLSWSTGWFHWFILIETILAIVLYISLRRSLAGLRWTGME